MDPGTKAVQDVQNQQSSDQPVNQTQQGIPAQPSQQGLPAQKQQSKTQQISVGGREAGAIVQEEADEDDDDEKLLVAPQEKKNSTSLGQNEGEEEEDETITVAQGQQITANSQENVELQPSGPEISVTASPEVEKVIERTENQENPVISKELQEAGVTHSGPGVIQVEENNFGVSRMPAVTYQQAAEQYKKTKLHDSRHWFLAMIMYIWRKLNPKQEKNGAEKELKVDLPAGGGGAGN
jgi:hypothetical protein